MPRLVEFDSDSPLWRAIEETAVETWRPGAYSSFPPDGDAMPDERDEHYDPIESETPSETPTAKKRRLELDTRITPGGVVKTDQGHQLALDASPIELVLAFRQMAQESASREVALLEEKRETNMHLEQIHAHLKTGVYARPRGYSVLVAVVVALMVAQCIVFLELYRLTNLVADLPHHVASEAPR